MESFNAASLRNEYRRAVLVCLALASSVPIYIGAVEFFARSSQPFRGLSPVDATLFSTLKLLLLAVTAVTFVMLPTIRHRFLAAGYKAGTVQEKHVSEPAERLMGSTLLSLALCESITIYGFILFLLNGAHPEFYLFLLISMVAFLVNFPRFSRWEAWARSISEARINSVEG